MSKPNVMKKENELIVRGLYERVVVNFSNALLAFNPINDKEKITSINNTFQNILVLFSKYMEGLIDLDNLLLLDKITFLNKIDDEAIIKAVSNNTNQISSTSNIYLKRNYITSLDETSFFVLVEENGGYIMRMITSLGSSDMPVTLEEIETDYISLDDALDTAEFVGKKGPGSMFYVLYRLNDNRWIVINKLLNNNIGIFSASIDIYLSMFSEKNNKYSNKELLKEAIVEQIQSALSEGRN